MPAAMVTRAPAPDVAFNGTDFRVVWRDLEGGSTGEIYGRRVGTDGSLLGALLHIGDGDAQQESVPRVASNGTSWLVSQREGNNGLVVVFW